MSAQDKWSSNDANGAPLNDNDGRDPGNGAPLHDGGSVPPVDPAVDYRSDAASVGGGKPGLSFREKQVKVRSSPVYYFIPLRPHLLHFSHKAEVAVLNLFFFTLYR